MRGILALVFVCLLADLTDAANVTGWTETGFTVSRGSTTASVTMKYDTKVVETSTADTVILTLTALPGGTYTYAFTANGNPGNVAKFTAASATSAEIKLNTGKSIDYETTKDIVFVVTATPGTGTIVGTATVTVEIKNKVEFSNTHYVACVADGSTSGFFSGTTVGTYAVADKASDDIINYALTPTTHFEYGILFGDVVYVKTGVTLDMKTAGGHTLTLTATPVVGSSSATTPATATLWVAVGTCSCSALQVTAMLGMMLPSFATALFL